MKTDSCSYFFLILPKFSKHQFSRKPSKKNCKIRKNMRILSSKPVKCDHRWHLVQTWVYLWYIFGCLRLFQLFFLIKAKLMGNYSKQDYLLFCSFHKSIYKLYILLKVLKIYDQKQSFTDILRNRFSYIFRKFDLQL